MKQRSLASQVVFEKYGRKSRRELFLDEMEKIVPWSGLEALVRPHYAKAGTVHTLVTTSANVADSTVLPDLLHGEERKVWGDGGYQGQTEAIKQAAPQAQDMTCRRTRFKHYVDELQRNKNRSKSSVRAKVEHVFRIVKRIFGFDKVRYRGLAKNHHRLCANFALANLYLHRKRLAVLG
jgi:IS5 family transposase